MAEKIRVIVLTIDMVVYEDEIATYKDYYKHLECDTFDVVMVEYKGERLSIYVDDEGMLKSGNLGRDVQGCPQPLFGNLVITGGVDVEGETLGVPSTITWVDVFNMVSEPKYIVKG